jgi:hypothetical protein
LERCFQSQSWKRRSLRQTGIQSPARGRLLFGACILIPKALFHRLGGFDLIYAPAYHEDAELAFKVRKAGLKAYYQPFSIVIHHERQSCATSTESGIKSYPLETTVGRKLHIIGSKIPEAYGHGLRELLLIAYFTQMGLTLNGHPESGAREIAIAWSLILVANDLLWSLPGGIWYLVRFKSLYAAPSVRRNH